MKIRQSNRTRWHGVPGLVCTVLNNYAPIAAQEEEVQREQDAHPKGRQHPRAEVLGKCVRGLYVSVDVNTVATRIFYYYPWSGGGRGDIVSRYCPEREYNRRTFLLDSRDRYCKNYRGTGEESEGGIEGQVARVDERDGQGERERDNQHLSRYIVPKGTGSLLKSIDYIQSGARAAYSSRFSGMSLSYLARTQSAATGYAVSGRPETRPGHAVKFGKEMMLAKCC